MYIKFLNNTSILENCAVTKIKQGVIRLYCKDMPVNPYAGFYVCRFVKHMLHRL